MEYIELIDGIKKKSNRDFMLWYRNKIQYTNEFKFYELHSNDRYFMLFGHLLDQYDDDISEYRGLLKLIIPDTDYFIECCKKKLINKISKNNKIYQILFYDGNYYNNEEKEEDNKYIIIAQQKTEIKYNQQKIKFNVIKVIKHGKNDWLNDSLYPSNKFILSYNTIETYFYNMEFKDGGMANRPLEDYDYTVNLYN